MHLWHSLPISTCWWGEITSARGREKKVLKEHLLFWGKKGPKLCISRLRSNEFYSPWSQRIEIECFVGTPWNSQDAPVRNWNFGKELERVGTVQNTIPDALRKWCKWIGTLWTLQEFENTCREAECVEPWIGLWNQFHVRQAPRRVRKRCTMWRYFTRMVCRPAAWWSKQRVWSWTSVSLQFERNPDYTLNPTSEMSQTWTAVMSGWTWSRGIWCWIPAMWTSSRSSRPHVRMPNNVWSGLEHLGTHEHGECGDPWSELWSDVVLMPIGMKASCIGASFLLVFLTLHRRHLWRDFVMLHSPCSDDTHECVAHGSKHCNWLSALLSYGQVSVDHFGHKAASAYALRATARVGIAYCAERWLSSERAIWRHNPKRRTSWAKSLRAWFGGMNTWGNLTTSRLWQQSSVESGKKHNAEQERVSSATGIGLGRRTNSCSAGAERSQIYPSEREGMMSSSSQSPNKLHRHRRTCCFIFTSE